ncbi:MAG: chemotaxis response regulator protein-glutamate methylesterase [Bacillota bacterium]|nr:chemotaxis response regulator protein-glutamate methylesterase [Bacillota bacterium]
MIKVLIVDDSISIQRILSQIINNTTGMTVIGTAGDPYEAIKILKKIKPDVITLDIEMPGMSGISFLKKLMHNMPIPVVMISSLTQKGATATIEALSIGAFDFIGKKSLKTRHDREVFVDELRSKLKNAAMTGIKKQLQVKTQVTQHSNLAYNKGIIAIGASTGGVQALNQLIKTFPKVTPPILIIQHMPEHFTKAFATTLNRLSKITVKEAEHREMVNNNTAYVAPGNYHMGLKKIGNHYQIELSQKPKVNRHRPSVDYTFHAIGEYFASDAIAILLTGMGDDGARGMKYLNNKGVLTIAESEASATIFGMPAKAIKLDAVDHILGLKQISKYLF